MPSNTEVLTRAFEAIDGLLGRSTEASLDEDSLAPWVHERCVFRDGIWTSIGALHCDFAEWRADHWQPIPVSRATFEAALDAAGVYVELGFCYGIVPKDHLKGLSLGELMTAGLEFSIGKLSGDEQRQEGTDCSSSDCSGHRGAGLNGAR